ncbi:MAG: SH3 domain-containing protein [Lachnospiraceae bacterium]
MMKERIGRVLLLSVLTAGICATGTEADKGYLLTSGAVVAASEPDEDAGNTSEPEAASTQYTLSTGMPGNDFVVDIVYGEEVVVPDIDTFTSQTDEDHENGSESGESEYANLAIADVHDYVNVRSTPSTDGEIVGKIYDGAVAQILAPAGENNEWFQIVSGNVEGYIKAEFFIYGDAAAEVVDEYVTRYAVVQADRLNVREEPDIEAKRIGYVDLGEKVKLLEDCGDWLKVQYTGNKEGYVAAEYVTIAEEFIYAKSIEEERAELEAQRELAARQAVSEQTAPENVTVAAAPAQTEFSTNEELRAAIVEDAMQYLGNVYIHGGKSLAGGTDCSGFTCFIYADFGYSISRTPSGQLSSAGRSIDYSEIQPGDIICYSSNGGKSCTHVGLYIGDGQIIHSANSRKGVIISNADYDTIIGIKNVID